MDRAEDRERGAARCRGWLASLATMADGGARRSRAAAVLAALLVATGLARAEPQAPAEPVLQPLSAVLPELRRGGFVIYMRHGATDTTRSDAEGGDLARCETQRNLSAAGRAQQAAAGRGIRALHIPIGPVVSSPFCRCKDTATLTFGRYDVVADLHFAMDASIDDRQHLSAALRERLATVPPPGTNTAIVSHNANLREATGLWPKPEGVAYIFKPLGNGRFEPVAKVLPDEWAAVAGGAAKP